MKRWVWNLFCLFSLLVFVSSVTIWVRSYFVQEGIFRSIQFWPAHWLDVAAFSSRGAVAFECAEPDYGMYSPRPAGWSHSQDWPAQSIYMPARTPATKFDLEFAGFRVRHDFHMLAGRRFSGSWLVLPLWLFLPSAIPPILWWRKRRKASLPGFPVTMAENAN